MKTLKRTVSSLCLTLAAIILFPNTSFAISWRYDYESALKEAKQSSKPMMIDFYTDWCGWCKKLDSDTYANPDINKLAENFVCLKINGDKRRDLVKKYNVSGYPSIFFLNSAGSVVNRVPGYAPPAQFKPVMNKVLKDTNTPLNTGSKKHNGSFILSGILAAGNSYKAIINDTIVGPGDTVSGAEVISISSASVIISQNGKKRTLTLSE